MFICKIESTTLNRIITYINNSLQFILFLLQILSKLTFKTFENKKLNSFLKWLFFIKSLLENLCFKSWLSIKSLTSFTCFNQKFSWRSFTSQDWRFSLQSTHSQASGTNKIWHPRIRTIALKGAEKKVNQSITKS